MFNKNKILELQAKVAALTEEVLNSRIREVKAYLQGRGDGWHDCREANHPKGAIMSPNKDLDMLDRMWEGEDYD